ncbi:MAG TPA: dephospho-CoA kinase [Geobacteraceae bacterium]
MHIIGLTGGIASGKSTVAAILQRLGVPVVDADQLAREVVRPGQPAHAAIVAAFGPEILDPDRSINRPRLGQVVFADPEARRRLEAITHPAIRRAAEEKLATLAQAGNRVAIYMAPLLVEAGVMSRVDEIWVVYVDRETQLERLIRRDGMSRDEALGRLAAQMPMEEKRLYGRVVIDNRGSRDATEQIVTALWERERQRWEL